MPDFPLFMEKFDAKETKPVMDQDTASLPVWCKVCTSTICLV